MSVPSFTARIFGDRRVVWSLTQRSDTPKRSATSRAFISRSRRGKLKTFESESLGLFGPDRAEFAGSWNTEVAAVVPLARNCSDSGIFGLRCAPSSSVKPG